MQLFCINFVSNYLYQGLERTFRSLRCIASTESNHKSTKSFGEMQASFIYRCSTKFSQQLFLGNIFRLKRVGKGSKLTLVVGSESLLILLL